MAEEGTSLGTGEEAAAATVEQTGTPEEIATKAAATEKVEVETGAPEAYGDFKLADGVELDTVAMEAALPIFKELGLTQDQAQKLVGLQTAQVQARAEAQQDQWEKTNDDWAQETKADPEFGGPNLSGSLAHVKTFLDKFASSEFRTMLDDTGMGNRLETLRLFASVGKAMSEDKITTGLTVGGSQTSVAQRMFPDQTP